MPYVIVSPAAFADVKRLKDFLQRKNPRAARNAAETIIKIVQGLGEFPEMGKIVEDEPGLRELFIEYGNYGYMAKYRYDGKSVYIVNIRAGREGSYREESL